MSFKHINLLTAQLKDLRKARAQQHEFTQCFTRFCAEYGLTAKTPSGRNKFTLFEQGQVSGAFHGFMDSLEVVFAYEYDGDLYTTNKNVPAGFYSTSELHQLGLTQDQWRALPNGQYYLDGVLFFKARTTNKQA